MLPDISTQLRDIVSNNNKINLKDNDIEKLVQILELYNNSILPIDVVKDNLNLKYEDVRALLISMAIKEIVVLNYTIWTDHPVSDVRKKVFDNYLDAQVYINELQETGVSVDNKIFTVFKVNLNE